MLKRRGITANLFVNESRALGKGGFSPHLLPQLGPYRTPQGPQHWGQPMVTPSISTEVSQELRRVFFSSSFRPPVFPNGYSCSANIKVICSKPTDTETFFLPHFSSCLRGGQANTSSPGLQAASQPELMCENALNPLPMAPTTGWGHRVSLPCLSLYLSKVPATQDRAEGPQSLCE